MNRRRFIHMLGATAATAMLPLPALALSDEKRYRWRGILLGTEGGFQLYHEEAGAAKAITHKAVNEIRRLESIFSLYQSHSAVRRLNRDGVLHNAPTELVECLRQAQQISQLTNGAFDPTVQPLWQLYSAIPSPTPQQLDDTLKRVDYRHIEITDGAILLREKAKITLNGIAQGFITDRITTLLKAEGITRTLVELGETRGLGKAWQIGLRNAEGEIGNIITLENKSVATSGGYATPLGDSNHLLNPRTGQSAKHHKSVSIIANHATQADALSTALSILPYAEAMAIVNKLTQVEARFS